MPKAVAYVECICQECGKAFRVRPSHAKRGKNKFCSPACSGKYHTTPKEIRFERFVQVCSHGRDCPYCCWPWQGSCVPNGYGTFTAYDKSKKIGAHRAAWELHHNKRLPETMQSCHYCHNRSCVNFDHLHPGTQKDNMADAIRDKRTARGNDVMVNKYPFLVKRGMKHHHTRLTDDDVRTIRIRHRQGDSLGSIARDYGYSKQGIAAIVKRQTWTHIL